MKDKLYLLPMLPEVNYQQFDDTSCSLVTFEYSILECLSDFLEHLKTILVHHHMIQVPELICAHLTAYLGTFTIACLDLTQARAIEPAIVTLLKQHADLSYSSFSTTSDFEQLKKNAPGSIVMQTLRLGRLINNSINELVANRETKFPHAQQKQKDLFCPQDEFFAFLLPLVAEQKINQEKLLGNKSLNHVINQITIQIGWLIGYFSHLDKKSPKEGIYLDYSIPVIDVYMEKTAHLVQAVVDRQHAETLMSEGYAPEDPELKAMIKKMGELSQSVQQSQHQPITNEALKQTALVDSTIRKEIVTLTLEGKSLRVIMMSLYYFWFDLEALLHGINITTMESYSPFDDLGKITQLILKTLATLPKAQLTKEQSALANQMNLLISKVPDQDNEEQPNKETIKYETTLVNARIHAITSEFIAKKVHPEIIANVLFSHWLRVSILYERQPEELMQQVDYYFKEVMTNIRKLIPQLFSKHKK